jgi:hypothetical protein
MYHPRMQEALLAAAEAAGADVRRVRAWSGSTRGGFASQEGPTGNVLAGVLLENVTADPDSTICMVTPPLSRMVLYFPQSKGTGRA